MCEAAFAVPAYPALPGASRNGATFRQSPSHRTVCRQTRGRELKFWASCSSPYYCRGTKCLGNKWGKKSGVLQHPLQKPFQLPCFLLSKSAQQTVEHLHRGRPKLGIDRFTLGSQLEIGRASVVGMPSAAHQASALEPVEHPCHRARVVRYVLAQS